MVLVGKFWVNQLLLLFVALSCVTIVTGRISEIPEKRHVVQRLNYGVLFKESSKLFLAQEQWLHTFKIDFPIVFHLNKAPTCTADQECYIFKDFLHSLDNIRIQTAEYVNKTISNIHSLIPHTNLQQKVKAKRALLGFVGSLSKSLFGTATMDDVNILAQHINELTKTTITMSNTLQRHGAHFSSFMSYVDNRTSNLMKGIKENHEQIGSFITFYNARLTNLQYAILNFSTLLTNQVHEAALIRSNLGEFYNSMQSLVHGKLTPLLLPRRILVHTLKTIQSLLTNSYNNFYLSHSDPNYFYTNADFFYIRKHSSIFVTVKFPISSFNMPLTLYKITSLPVPVNNNTNHATQLLNLPNYIAFTNNREHYVHFSDLDLTRCSQSGPFACSFNKVLKPISSNDCALALYNNNKLQVKKLCDFKFIPNFIKSNLIELSDTSILAYNVRNLEIHCPNEQNAVKNCTFCIINLSCKCSVSADNLFFAERLMNCYNDSVEFSVVHPVNLALLQQFFNDQVLSNIFADSFFAEPINMQIPKFNFYNHSFQKVIAVDQQNHFNLEKVAKAARKEETIFQSLTQPLIEGQIDISPSWPDFNAILIFVTFGFAVLSSLLGVWLFFKIRKFSISLMVLQQIAHAKAQTPPSFIFNLPTSTTKKPDVVDLKAIFSEFSWIHGSVVLSICVLVLLLVITILLFRKYRQRKCTSLYVEITSGGECITVPVLTLPLCPSYWEITVPQIKDLSVSKFPVCKLFAVWSNFTVTNKLTNNSVQVPSSVSVNIFVRSKLAKILKQPFCVYILIEHQGMYTVLKDDGNKQFTSSLYPALEI